jgi:hypothetical protein
MVIPLMMVVVLLPPCAWFACARFDELPVAQLPASHDDPRIAAGLEVIRQLDEQLKDAWIKVRGLFCATQPVAVRCCGCMVPPGCVVSA